MKGDQHSINDVCTCHKVVFILSCFQDNLHVYYNQITCTSLVAPGPFKVVVMILKIANI